MGFEVRGKPTEYVGFYESYGDHCALRAQSVLGVLTCSGGAGGGVLSFEPNYLAGL